MLFLKKDIDTLRTEDVVYKNWTEKVYIDTMSLENDGWCMLCMHLLLFVKINANL